MLDTIRTALRERIDARDLDVPILNSTAIRLLSICGDSDFDIGDVTTLVSYDQALAGHVLRVANSAAYSPVVEVASVQDAVSRLGVRSIADICVTMVVRDQVFRARGPRGGLIQNLWKRASLAGVFAQKIGQLLRGNHDLALLCGLLQDIGKPILLRLMIDLEEGLGAVLPPCSVEELLEPLHEEVGRAVIQEWKLPGEIAVAAASHHRWEQAGEPRVGAMVAHLADRLAHWTLEPEVREDQPLTELAVVRALGLNPTELGGLFSARERIRELAEAFS